ncbi:putative ABC transporter, permease protein [Treponema primitia ZAS-2]|uniref:Putative ABC transporter, permease protein n=1 Tax=Treponema primitia (strain ATCC BAA-887 / DSM 12427 / ZAS-2) TaxID=545694 RepID=F5YNW7_TREPZ|nr:ABC transporter permease subunit [Treponema primitia]AEF86923.1 putative ABC transporter, permease protein [Treponema primitia ZAS-2]
MKNIGPVKLLLALVLLVTIVCPLLAMLANLAGADVAEIIGSEKFKQALGNSIAAAGAGTLISIAIAYVFALCVVRTGIRFREAFSVFVTLPMLIPSISHGMGLVILLGSNGVITRFLGLHGTIYGFRGIVMGSVLYAFPVAFLMLADILKYEDGSPYEAASVLGIPRYRQFFSITFPYLRKPLISVVFATFTLIFTDYGVPLMIGGRFTTLPVLMYQEVIGLLNFSRGSVIGAFLLIPAVIAFAFDLASKERGNQSFVIQEKARRESRVRNGFAYGYCALVCILIALPIVVFVVLTFVARYPEDMRFSLANIAKTMNMGAGRYLVNSLIIALGVSVLGTLLSYIIAYCTARFTGKSSKALHLISITSLAIPGLVLGLAYVLFFKGSFIYGTLSMLILVNTVHFLASPYLMAYNSLGKLNHNLEDVGRTLGISRFRILKDVLIPQTKLTIVEMLSYFFVNSMMTISAVSFLNTVRNKPVSLMITQFEAQLFLEAAAFVSLIILVCNFIIKCLVYVIRKNMKRNGD